MVRKRDILREIVKSRRGKPTECMLCSAKPTWVAYDDRAKKKHAFLCDEHIGPFIVVWTSSHQIWLVKL